MLSRRQSTLYIRFTPPDSWAEEASTMKENRTDTRFDICLTARWQGCPTNHNVRISDLSNGGCYMDTIAEVTVGETLFLKILLADANWLELQGVVIHHSPRLGFGVRFVNLDGKQHDQIRSLLGLQNASLLEPFDTSCCEPFIPGS